MRIPRLQTTGVGQGRAIRAAGGKARLRLYEFLRKRGHPTRRRRRGPQPLATMAADIAQVYIDTAVQLRGVQQAAGAGPTWQSLGPTGVDKGQTYGANRVLVSGRVAAIAVDPTDSNHVLVGSAAGGIWDTADGGATWTPRTDWQPTLTIGAIAFDPSQPSTVYAGTGEGNWYLNMGAGVLRSADSGATWAVVGDQPFVGHGFFDLLVDSSNSSHLFAATTAGFHDSSDGGATWTQRRRYTTWTVSQAQLADGTLELMVASADGVFTSSDGGQNWLQAALPGAPAYWQRIAAAHAPSNPTTAFVWGSVGNGPAMLFARAADGTWQALDLPPGVRTNQAWYDWYVRPAPDADSQIYLGAIDLHRADFDPATGWTWQNLSSKSSGPSGSIHPDQHVLTCDPADPNTVYAGNDGGLFRSRDRGITWESLNAGLGITEIEYIAQDPSAATWLLAGTQDNGTIRWTDANGWEHVADGDGGGCGVDRTEQGTVFHTFYGMGVQRSTRGGDFGSWSSVGPSVPPSYRALFYPPTDSESGSLAQAGQSLFVSRDDGATWSEVALPAALTASDLYMPSADRVLVGTTEGRLFDVQWSGSDWGTANEMVSPRAAWISDMYADPNNANRMWVTCSWTGGTVFRSDDGGASWTDCSAGLPALPIHAIEVDTTDANRVWVAADLGVFESRDAGATWSPLAQGLPNALIEDLQFHAQSRLLRCATRSRGVWQVNVDG